MEPTAAGTTTYCYIHTKTPTGLRCSRCDRPICGRCATPASVGQQCPECLSEGRRRTPKVKVRSGAAAAAPAVFAILVANGLVFVIQLGLPEFTHRFSMIPAAVAAGEWWRLVTAMFLHAPGFFFHILINSFILWSYGPNVEEAFGTPRFVAIYLVAGFTGAVASYLLHEPGVESVGASGAIFGVAGALIVYLYNRRDSIFTYGYMRNLLLFVGINLAIGFIIPFVDNYAHIGGLLGGAALGFAFDRRATKGGVAVQAAALIAVVGVAGAVALLRTATL